MQTFERPVVKSRHDEPFLQMAAVTLDAATQPGFFQDSDHWFAAGLQHAVDNGRLA